MLWLCIYVTVDQWLVCCYFNFVKILLFVPYSSASACIDVYGLSKRGCHCCTLCDTHNRLCFHVSYSLSYKFSCCQGVQLFVKQQYNEKPSSLYGKTIFFFNFLLQVPQVCPLSVLLNPVFEKKNAPSCQLKVNSAPINLSDTLRKHHSIRLDCKVSTGRHRVSLQLLKAEFGEYTLSYWLINLTNMHLHQTAKLFCSKILNAK